jgi:hypothetical protein
MKLLLQPASVVRKFSAVCSTDVWELHPPAIKLLLGEPDGLRSGYARRGALHQSLQLVASNAESPSNLFGCFVLTRSVATKRSSTASDAEYMARL